MQQTDSNFLNMVQAVLANLKNDKSYWAGETEIVAEINDIETEYNVVMETLNSISGLDQRGYTTAKHNAFDRAMAATLKLCKKMCVYARRNNDNALLSLVNHSQNSLSTGMEKDAISRCAAIVNKAMSMLPALQPFKVTENELATIKQFIASYNQQIDGRTTIKTNKTTSVQDTSSQISALRERLDLLDDLVEGFIDDDEMIARYKASRNIANYGKAKTAKNKVNTNISTNTPS